MTEGCRFFSVYMADFRRRLTGALDEHKWYMSERARHDVGHSAAEADFLDKHFDALAREIRVAFCRQHCEEGRSCRLAAAADAIPSTSETLRVHASARRPDAPGGAP